MDEAASSSKPRKKKRAKAVSFEVGIKRALRHWKKYYEHQMYERRFVECQSGLAFTQWQAVTERMSHLLPRLLADDDGSGAAAAEEKEPAAVDGGRA